MYVSKIYDVLEEATEILKHKPLLRRVKGTAIVSGDLHGDYDALKQLKKIRKKNKAKNLVLLGDFVDRGDKQLEVIFEIAKLVIKDKNFFPLRGNHEDENICTINRYQRNGFEHVIKSEHLDLDPFLDFFAQLPIAAVSNNSFMCHGGLPVNDINIDKIDNYSRVKSMKIQNQVVNSNMYQFLWNDPLDDQKIQKMHSFPSPRDPGNAFWFGEPVTYKFLEKNDLKFLLRAHEVFSQGAKWMQNDRILSLFTSNSGHYAKKNINRKCAFIDLSDKNIERKDITLLGV